MTQITHDLYDLLTELQDRLSHVIKSVGKIEHSFWRAFNTEVKTEACEGFIDGDLIESFLDLPRKEMVDVISGIQVRTILVVSKFKYIYICYTSLLKAFAKFYITYFFNIIITSKF